VADHFEFMMPGQPPSWNHMYRWTTRNMAGRTVRIQVKTDEVNLYQTQLAFIARTAKPGSFHPDGQIVVTYEMYLARDLDADNVLKAVNDALAAALDVNDKRFLPIVLSKEAGDKNPRVTVGVYDAAYWHMEMFHS